MNRPPGMMILPALARAPPTGASRCFGKPSFLRSRLVKTRSTSICTGAASASAAGIGAGLGSRENDNVESELIDEDGDPGTEYMSGGVAISPSPSSWPALSVGAGVDIFESVLLGATEVPRTRFATDCELSEEAEDSSKVRLGERYSREGSGDAGRSGYAGGVRDAVDSGMGDGDRESGRGTWAGVSGIDTGSGSSAGCGASDPRRRSAFVLSFAGGFENDFDGPRFLEGEV